MDIFPPEKRSEIMSSISGKNTKPELLLRRELHRLGLRYRLHSKDVFGKPDVVFRRHKVAVFVDGDWWHGRNYNKEHVRYSPFWQAKIKANMKRDKIVNKSLREQDWKVFRIWQKDLVKDPNKYAEDIYKYIKQI